MFDNAYHPSGSISQPTYEGCTLPSLQLNLEGGQLFFLLKVKVPMSGQVIVINIYFLWGCGGSDADSSLPCSVWCHSWHQARWRQVQFYFYYTIRDLWLNFKFLCTVFLRVYPCAGHCISKIMRWSMFPWSTVQVMNAYIDNVYILEDDKTSQKKMYHQHFLFLTPKYILE